MYINEQIWGFYLANTQCLLSTSRCSKCFTYIKLPNPHNPTRWKLLWSYYYRVESCKFRSLSQGHTTNKLAGGAGFLLRYSSSRVHTLNHHTIQPLFRFWKIITIYCCCKPPYRDINLIYSQYSILSSISKCPEFIIQVCTLKFLFSQRWLCK